MKSKTEWVLQHPIPEIGAARLEAAYDETMNYIGQLDRNDSVGRTYLSNVRAIIVAAAYLAYRDERLTEQIDAEYPVLEPYAMVTGAVEPVLELLKETRTRLQWQFKRKSTLNEYRAPAED